MATENDPVTKKDLLEMEVRLEAKLDEKLDAKLDAKLGALKDELAELIGDSQTEILRGFHTFQSAWGLRLRKVEADHSNLDAATTARLTNLEERLFEIEKKIILGGRPQYHAL